MSKFKILCRIMSACYFALGGWLLGLSLLFLNDGQSSDLWSEVVLTLLGIIVVGVGAAYREVGKEKS
jgi:hypothetical protein